MIAVRDLTLAADAEARSFAQTEFQRPLVIEAGAGTGKTALLVARIVSWCVGPGWQRHASGSDSAAVPRRVLEGLVAITFTEAAAAEMAERVARAWSTLAAGELPLGVDRELLGVADDVELATRSAALADEVHRLQAQTIHSWCHHLLRAYPLESGVHPRFEVDGEGRRVEAAAEQAVAEALRGLPEAADRLDWEAVAAAGVAPSELADAVRRLVQAGVTPEELLEDPCRPGVMKAVLERLGGCLAALERAGLGAFESATKATAAAASELVRLDREITEATGDDPERIAAALERVGDATRTRLAKWSRFDFTQTELRLVGSETALAEAATQLAPLLRGLRGFDPRFLGAARRSLAALVRTVTDRLAHAGVTTFDELLRLAARLLEQSPAVRREVRGAVDQLLVDEFQDTDEVQCRLIRALALAGGDPAPGLFIVGDPKQSIYGWRRADLAAYDSFKADVERAGGLVRPLIQNFRSTQRILDEVGRAVAPVMIRETGIQPEYQELAATGDRRTEAGFDHDPWAPVELWVTRPENPDGGGLADPVLVDEALALEAEAVAEDIARLVDEGAATPKEIAILVRSTTTLEPLLDRLRERGVPFEVSRERQYYQQREVVEAAALVRTIIEPSDRLALLTVLRSDAVGVPDAALAPLWDAGLPEVMAGMSGADGTAEAELETCLERAVASIPADAPAIDELPRWPAALRRAAVTIGWLRTAIRESPPDRFVERLRTLWLTEATASARFLGRFRRARLERFFAELETGLTEDDGSLAPVARLLRRAVEEGREPQVPGDPDVAADAVHVMTIHGAKGLDFDHVYVCQIHKGDPGGIGRSPVELLPTESGLEYRLFRTPTPGYGEAEDRRLQRERAERVRLLYVATTRAKRRLVISGRWRLDGALVAASDAGSFEDLLGHRLSPEGLEQQAREGHWRWREPERDVQWVLPAYRPPRPEAGASDATARDPYDVHRVRREAGRLARLRKDAAARAELPLTAVASSLHDDVRLETDRAGIADREAARAAGTAVHRLLEMIDLHGDPVAQVSALKTRVQDWAAAAAIGDPDAARSRVREILDVMIEGRCLPSLSGLADDVVARELPLMVPAGENDPAVSAVLGVADLVYRRDDGLVVADFKTDSVATQDQVEATMDTYRPQLELYARALEQALDLPGPPAMELWFLYADRIVSL